MASSFRLRPPLNHWQQVTVLCLLLWCFAVNQVVGNTEDELPIPVDTNIERLLNSASVLRNNMLQALGTILQHQDAERQLTWQQLLTIRQIHDSLSSRETNVVQLLLEANEVFQSQSAITVEQETSILFSLLLKGSSTRSASNKIVGILKYYNIGSMLKGLPVNLEQVGSSELHYIKNVNKKTFFDIILKKIQHGYITLTSSLLVDILNNIHLQCFLPETHEVLHTVTEELLHKQNKLNSLLQRITINPLENLSDFLLKILKFLGSEQSPLQLSVKLHIWKLIPLLTPGVCKNTKPKLFITGNKYHELFLAIRDDEFPCDVISTRDIITSAISTGKLDLTKYSDGFIPTFYGNDRLSVLFAFLARLSFSLPNAHPASGYVHTLLSHVKMKYITSKGDVFIPTVQLDIAMFLNSFNTLGIDLTETNVEIYHAFQQEIQWKKILQDFPFSQYSQPRPLFIAMIRKILHTDTEIKTCHRIILKYFLAKVQNTFNQCQNLQILVSQKELNPFENPTTQITWPKAPILLQPVNIFNAMLPAAEVPLSETQIITARRHEKFAVISTPFHDSVRRFTNERKPQQHTARMFTPLTYALKPKLLSVPLLSKTNDEDEGSTTFTQKYSSNINLDTAIKVVVNNNLQNVQKAAHGMLPTTYTVCTGINDDQLYISVNDQVHISACAHIKNQQETMPTNITTQTPAQEHESSRSTEFCASSPGSVVWVDVSSLMKAVDSRVTETMLQTVVDILTPDLIHGFNITSQDTKGKLLYKILSFIIMNINFGPSIMNAIKYIKNNVHMDGPGAERPILICLNYTSYTTSTPPVTATSPIQTHTAPITCTDDITKEDGIQVAAVRISSLLTAIAPNAPQQSRNIITEFLGKSDIPNHLKNFNFEKYRTRGPMLQHMLTFLSHQVTFQSSNVKHAIGIILPFIQTDGPGALHPETDLVCDTSKPLKRTAEATKSKTRQDNDVQSTAAKYAKLINLKSTKITLPPNHIMFAEKESSSTAEAITLKMETTMNTAPAYGDMESTTSQTLTSNSVQPTTITSLPSYIAYPSHITAEELTIQDHTEAMQILAYNSTIADTETALKALSLTQTTLTKTNTPDKILQAVHTAGLPTLQSGNLNYDDQENSTFICPDNQVKRNIPNITALLESVDKTVSNGHILNVKNFLQRNDIVKLLQELNLEHLATKAEMLAQIITSVKLTHPILDPMLDTALNNILNNIHSDGTGSMRPDFMWVCQVRDEKIPTLPTEIKVSTDATTHAEKNILKEHTVQQRNVYTKDTAVATSPEINTDTDVTSQTTEPYTLPTVVQTVYQGIVTNTTIQCSDQQVVAFEPNIRTLLQDVDQTVSVQSLNTVITFFETKDIAEILNGFYTEEFKTHAELLIKLLTFVKIKYVDLQNSTLDAFDEILSHIQSDKPASLKPNFIFTCQDISTSQVTETPSQTSTGSVIPNNTKTMTAIDITEKSTDTQVPTLSTTHMHDTTTTRTKLHGRNPTPFITHATQQVTVTTSTPNEETERYTLNCSNRQITAIIPNMKSLLNSAGSTISTEHTQIIINFLQRQEILHALQNFDIQKYATKADMLTNVITFLNLTYTDFDSDVRDTFKNILSKIVFDGKLVTQHDYTELCNDTTSEKTNSPIKEPMPNDDTTAAYSVTTIIPTVIRSTTKPTTTQPPHSSPLPSPPESTEVTSTLFSTSSSKTPILISCVNTNAGTQIISYNTTALFDSLDPSTPTTEKDILITYLTQPHTYIILRELPLLYPNSQDTEFNAVTSTMYGSILKEILLFLRNRSDVKHDILTAIDTVLHHIRSQDSSAVHLKATTACNNSHAQTDAQSKPGLGQLSVNKTQTSPTPQMFTLTTPVETTHSPTEGTTTDRLTTESETSSTHLTTVTLTLPVATSINFTQSVTNASIHCSNEQTAMHIPNIKTLLKTLQNTNNQQSLSTAISFFERHDIVHILQGFHSDEFKTQGDLLNKMLTFIKLKYQNLQQSVLDAFNDILSHTQSDALQSLKPDFILVCQDNEIQQHTTSVPQITIVVQTPKEEITNTTQVTFHHQQITNSEPPMHTEVETATELSTTEASTAGSTTIPHLETTESFTLPKLHNIKMSGKEIQTIKFCTEQETVSIPNMKTLLQAYETVIPNGQLNAALNFFSRKDIVHVLKRFSGEDFKTRGTLLTNLITFVKNKYSELTHSELNAFNEILSHIHLTGEESLNPDFIKVCEDTSTVPENSSAKFVSREESNTTRTHAIVHKESPSSLKDINEIHVTANKTGVYTEETISSTKGFADLYGLTQTETTEAMPPIKSTSQTPTLSADTTETTTLMAVQTTEPATTTLAATEYYILGSKLRNTSKAILHSVTDTTYADVSSVLNNTTGTKEVEISHLAPSDETSETEELDYVHEEPETEKIKITSICFDNGTMQILTVDVSPLVHTVNRPNMTLLQIGDIFKAPGTQNKLKTFNWETYHETKGELLKDIIDFLIKTVPHKQEYLFLNMVIPFINMDNKGAKAPSFMLSCITEKEPQNGTIKNITLEDTAGGPATVKPTHEWCNNEAMPTLEVNIHTLFKALKPTTPHLPKAVVTAYLTKHNFYRKVSNFSLLNFKTCGEQLQELLVYLVNETHVNSTLMKATNILLQNVRLNGPGKCPPSVKIVCNSTLNTLTGIPLQKLHGILVTTPAVTTQILPTSVLAPCIKSESGRTYQIDFLSILHALKPSAPRTSLTVILSFITKPEFYTVLKNFDIAVYKRRGDLLASLFLFLIVKLRHNQHMVQALKEILPYIEYDGPGAESPDITPKCVLFDSKEVPSVKTNAITEQNHSSQGPKLIDMDGNECTSLTPNSSHVQGTTFYKIDVESLTKILNDTTLQKDATNLFVSEHLQNSLHLLNLNIYSSRAELLTGILHLLENYPHVDHNNLGLLKEMKSHIQFEGEGELPPVISLLCTERSVKPNPQYIIYATNETCFMPSEYSTTGMTYELQTETLLQTINEDTPQKIVKTVISFFKNENVPLYLHGFNIFRYRTQGELTRDLMVFLATNPEIKLEYKQAMATIVPYIGMDGPGGISPVIRTTCPEYRDSNVINITSANDMKENTPKTPMQDITTPNSCRSNPNAIIMPQFDDSLFEALDGNSPNRSVAIIMKHLSKKNIMQTELQEFDIEKYTTKGNLLQALLAFIWAHKDSHEENKQAAKTLLPHVIFNGPAQEPPNVKTQCYIPNSSPRPGQDSESLHPPTLVYPTNRTCITNITRIPGIIVYRIGLPTLFKALKPSTTHQLYTPIEDFLSKPYAYKYIHGIYMERYNTRGQLLRAILTILRFTSRQLERKVKQAVFTILPSVQVDGTGKLPVERHAICSALLSEDEMNAIDLGEITQTITQGTLNTEVRDSLNAITKLVTSSQFNLTEYLPWLDSEKPITQGELLKLILLQISDKNQNIRKQATILIPYVQEKRGVGKKVVKIGTVRDTKNELPYEIDFSQLLHVLKPEAPKQAVATLLNFFGKLDMYKQLKGFNPDIYQTQGELLTSILMYLKGRYDANTELMKTISALIPFVDHDGTGSLPPIIKKLYIITNTSESVFILDLGTLYRVIPRKNLTKDGKEALDTIFRYLSANETDYIGLLQGINSRLSPELQLKLILHRLKEVGDTSLKSYTDTLLVYLERQLIEQSHQHTEQIPDMDWIQTLHAIPNTGVPALVTASKKELYKYFLSQAFRNAVRNFHISLSLNRAKFLKVLLAYLRSNSEVTKIKVIKDAISYVYMFIKDEGDGLVSVQDDIIWPDERREARNAQNHIKELIYQVLGLTEQEGASEILQTLQSLFDLSSTLDIETTYIGYNILEEFPPNERLIIILQRIYQNFQIFLDQDTISAIDMVFISLGETKEQTSQTFHFLPINFEDLLKTVLGQETPAVVAAAAETLESHVNLKTVPLGKAFRDTVPSILNLNPNNRLAIVLQILWRTYSRNHDDKLLKYIKTVYEHIQPQTRGSVIQTQDHHKAIITALTSLIHKNAPPNVQDAKQAVINNLIAQQNMYDKALANLVTKNLPPQELIARALRRFREHQYKINPQLWLSVSTIFEYLSIPEHDSTEDETDDSISVVDEFKYLTDEAGITVAPAKRILMQFMIDRKQEISKIFHGQRVLLKYAPQEKMAILLGRLLRMYGGTLEPEIINAAETILTNLNSSAEIEDEEKIDILQLLDTVIDQDSPHNVITAKNLVKTTLQENPSMIPQILNGIVIQKDFNQQRQLAVVLRRIYRKFKLKLSKEMSQSLMILFDHLEISYDISDEDQFAGNVTFEPIFQKVFPKEETPHEVAEAVRTVLDLFTSEQVEIKQILHGLHLWKLPTETQVSLILYRLTKNTNLNQADMSAVTTLLRSLDTDLDELATGDVDESYTPEKLFSEALGNMHIPAEVQEAKGIIMHFLLSDSPKLKDIYHSRDFATLTSAKERLVVILKNVHKKQGILERRMIEALQVMSNFLHVQLKDHEIDPHTFDFRGAFDRAVPPTAPPSVQHAKNLLLRAMKKQPGTFKKIFDHITTEEYENNNEPLFTILHAIANYKHRLSIRIRRATDVVIKFLTGVPIDDKSQQMNESEYFDENETSGLRM